MNDDILNLIQNLVSVNELRQLEKKVFTVRHPPNKTTTRTHEGKLLGVHIGVHRSGKGVHIGVYKPSHLIAIDSTIGTIIR